MGKYRQELQRYKWIYIAFGCVIILSAVLRLWGLGNTPFVADEFLDINASYGYHKTGQWQAWDFNHDDISVRDNKASDERAWLYRWQVAKVLDYIAPTEFNARLVSALWGILTTVIIFFVTFSFTKNRWIALLAAFFWAVSIPAIELNRKVRMYSMFVPIFLLFSWSLFQFIDSRARNTFDVVKNILNLHWIYLVPTIIFGAIAYHLHPLTGNAIFALFLYLVVMLIFEQRRNYGKHATADSRGYGGILRYGIYAIVLLVGALGVYFFVPNVWKQFATSLVFFDNHWSYIGHVLGGYWHPLLGLLFIFVGAWYLTTQKKDERPGVWITTTFFAILLAAIFLWKRNVGAQYIFFVQPFGFMLVAGGVYYLAQLMARRIGEKRAFAIVIILSIALLPSYLYFFQKDNTYHITSKADTANYRNVFLYVKKHAQPTDAMITRNFRSYYYGGLDIPILDFGSERSEEELKEEGKVKKITVADVERFAHAYPVVWIVYSDNDEKFITKEARAYFAQNCEKINDLLVRGKVSVYKCENM